MQSIKKSKKEGIRRKGVIYASLVALCDKYTHGHSFIHLVMENTHRTVLETLAKQEVMNLIKTNPICFNNVMFITLECLSIVNQNVTDKFPTATITNL